MSHTSPPVTECSRPNGTPPIVPLASGPMVSVLRADAAPISDDAIAKLAYEKFVARGCSHGHDEEDWAAAKRDLSIVTSGE